MLSMCAIAFTLSQAPVAMDPMPSIVQEIELDAMVEVLTGYTSGSLVVDINGDGVVDFFDVVAFITCFNSGAACADLNGDGVNNFFDIQLFIAL